MLEMQTQCSLFTLPCGKDEVAVVTTNGVVRRNGSGVMGAGQALEAKKLFPGIEQKLGIYVGRYGNRVFNMGTYGNHEREMTIVTFPTKNHYRNGSILSLIAQSAQQLKEMADKFGFTKVYLPAVGCGLGGLDYQRQVRPILMKYLNDDRFIVVLGYKGF